MFYVELDILHSVWPGVTNVLITFLALVTNFSHKIIDKTMEGTCERIAIRTIVYMSPGTPKTEDPKVIQVNARTII